MGPNNAQWHARVLILPHKETLMKAHEEDARNKREGGCRKKTRRDAT